MPKKDPLQKLAEDTQRAYRLIFKTEKGDELNEAAKMVLADLRLFCNGTQSCLDSDPIQMAAKCARQEVFQRITNYLELEYASTLLLDVEVPEE